jgi:hypothetical protein
LVIDTVVAASRATRCARAQQPLLKQAFARGPITVASKRGRPRVRVSLVVVAALFLLFTGILSYRLRIAGCYLASS